MAVTAMNRPDFPHDRDVPATASEGIGRPVRAGAQAVPGSGACENLATCRSTAPRVRANASVHKAMSYGRMHEAEKKLAAEVAAWFAQAEATDAAEDRKHGPERRGDEMPDWVANKMARLERIRAAKAVLEAEAKAPPPDPDDDGPGPSSGMTGRDDPAATAGPNGGPPDRAQRNFTDPDSRIQPVKPGVIAGYNAQIAVDGAHQIIIAQRFADQPGRCTQPQATAERGTHRASRQSRRSVRRRRFLLGSQSGSSGPSQDQWLRRHRPAPAR